MRVAKPSEEDFDATLNLLNGLGFAIGDTRPLFSSDPSHWKGLDEDDDDFKICKAIQMRLAMEERLSPDEVDDKIVMYEYIKQLWKIADCRWRRVYWAALLLSENVQDPFEDCLAFHPSFETFHVANEQ